MDNNRLSKSTYCSIVLPVYLDSFVSLCSDESTTTVVKGHGEYSRFTVHGARLDWGLDIFKIPALNLPVLPATEQVWMSATDCQTSHTADMTSEGDFQTTTGEVPNLHTYKQVTTDKMDGPVAGHGSLRTGDVWVREKFGKLGRNGRGCARRPAEAETLDDDDDDN
uniref:Uncharacterized protein n=1 Tax=Timema tahoe TaxID=61484 RepID=A0A7R9ID92_9NEOP|nr:unnamed protein product [Timema tahoe]